MVRPEAGGRGIVQVGQVETSGQTYNIYLVNGAEYRVYAEPRPLKWCNGMWLQLDEEGVRDIVQRWQS